MHGCPAQKLHEADDTEKRACSYKGESNKAREKSNCVKHPGEEHRRSEAGGKHGSCSEKGICRKMTQLRQGKETRTDANGGRRRQKNRRVPPRFV